MIPQPRVGVTTGMALHCFRRAGDRIFHPSLSLSTYQNKGGESHPRCWFARHLVGKLSYVIDSSFSHQYSLSPPQFGLKTPSRPSRVDKGCFHWITWFLSVFFFILPILNRIWGVSRFRDWSWGGRPLGRKKEALHKLVSRSRLCFLLRPI